MTEKIQSVMIFEILGKPKEYIQETLGGIIDRLGNEKGVKIIERRMHESKEVENSDLFTAFAEVESEIDGLQKFIIILFTFMPAHVEIISPSEIKLKNFELNAVSNELITKLHNYDSVAKTALFKNNMLEKRLNEALEQGKINLETKKILPARSDFQGFRSTASDSAQKSPISDMTQKPAVFDISKPKKKKKK